MQELESLREVENLRFRFQMNNRLRLESLAELSKLFREFGEPISDDLLSSVVFALPRELVSNGHSYLNHVDSPSMKADADGPPETQPGQHLASEQPKPRPNLPPESPAKPNMPPESPAKPNMPPESPKPR
jgi:hypothetical protein